jgi:large subunit ribosomal protein L33
MAKQAREVVNLECSECKRINYQTTKNTKPKTGKPTPLNLNKYCKWCKKHTEHKEVK